MLTISVTATTQKRNACQAAITPSIHMCVNCVCLDKDGVPETKADNHFHFQDEHTTTEQVTVDCNHGEKKQCNDAQNVEQCNWDGGACCGWSYLEQYHSCHKCECKDPSSQFYKG